MQVNQKIVLRSVAIIMAATAILQFMRQGVSSYWYFFTHFTECLHFAGGWPFTVLALTVMFIPLLKLSAFVGLCIHKHWGWVLSIALLSVDFLLGLNAAFWLAFYAISPREVLRMGVPQGSFVETISMWPTFIIAIIGAISVLILLLRPVKKQCAKEMRSA